MYCVPRIFVPRIPCIVSPEFPEKLPAAEDVKKVERRLVLEQKKTLNNPTALEE